MNLVAVLITYWNARLQLSTFFLNHPFPLIYYIFTMLIMVPTDGMEYCIPNAKNIVIC